MAKIERYINEDFEQLLSKIENGIINGSMSATLEDASDFRSGTARCSVRVFERYSYASDSSRLSENTEDPRKFNIPWVFSFCQNLRICV